MRRLLCLLAALLLTLIPCCVSAQEVGTSAKACIIIDEASGRVLISHNAEAALPMASTTKVMTALLAIELGDLDAPVTSAAMPLAYPVPASTWQREKPSPCGRCSMG